MALEKTIKIKVDSSGAKRSIDKIDGSLGRLDNSANKTNKSFFTLKQSVIAVGAALQVAVIARYADTFTSLQNQIKQTTNTTEELTKTTQDLLDVANRSRQSFAATSELYTQLNLNVEDLGFSSEKLLRITETIGKSFAIGGKSAEDNSRAIRQLNQAFGRGVLRGDEFISVAEGAPEIFRAMKRSLGLTSGELDKFAKTGGITTKVLVKALDEAAEVIDKKMLRATKTLAQSFQEAENNTINFIGSSRTVSSVMGVVGESVISLSNNLDSLAVAVGITASLFTAKLAAALTESALKKIADAKASTLLAAETLRAEKAANRFVVSKEKEIKSLAKKERIEISSTATTERINLVRLISEKKLAQQTVISARNLAKKSNALVINAEKELTLSLVEKESLDELLASNKTREKSAKRISAAESLVISSKKSSKKASEALTTAELSASASQKSLTASKASAIVVTKKLATAKTAEALASANVTKALSLETAATVRVSIASKAAALSVKGLKGALAFLGGPVGVAVLAAVAIGSYALAETDAEKRTKQLTDRVNDQIKSMRELGKTQKELAERELSQVNIQIKEMQERFLNLKLRIDDTSFLSLDLPGLKLQARQAGDELAELFKQRELLTTSVSLIDDSGVTAGRKKTGQPDLAGEKADDAFARRFEQIQSNIAKISEAELAGEKRNTESLRSELAERLSVQRAFNEIILTDFNTLSEQEAAINEFNRQAELIHLAKRREDSNNDFALKMEEIETNDRLLGETKLNLQIELEMQQIAQNELFELEKTEILQNASNRRMEIEKDEAQARKDIAFGAFGDVISGLSVFGKKAAKVQLTAARINAGVKGKEAAVAAWEAGMSTGGPQAPFVAAAYAAASILKTSAIIKSMGSGGSGGGGGGGISQSGGGGSQFAQRQEPIQQSNVIEFRGLSEVAAELRNLDPGEPFPVEFTQRIVASLEEFERVSGGNP